MSYAMQDLVKQETTTAGTGDLTLGAALAGYATFEDGVSDLDYVWYEVHAVDVGGGRTGEYETGIGQFWLDGATPKLRRVMPSNNSAWTAPLPLNFSAGTKHVYITAPGALVRGLKIEHDGQGVPVLYVRSTGNDDNSGFGDGAGDAFATLERAIAVALECFSKVYIDIGAGTFGDVFIDVFDRCDITLLGAGRASTTIGSVYVAGDNKISLFDLTLAHATSVALTVNRRASARLGAYSDDAATISFGACPAGHMKVNSGGRLELGDYHIAGGCSAGAHIAVDTAAWIALGGEQTFDASATFSGGFLVAGSLSCVKATNAYVIGANVVLGKRYEVTGNAVIDTSGAGASHFPGNVAGTAATGGQYL